MTKLGLEGTQKEYRRALEPTTGLDPLAARNVDAMILATCDQFKVTSVVISHDMARKLAGGHA